MPDSDVPYGAGSRVADARAARRARSRVRWLQLLHQWHWVSAALCLIGMILFAVTGITLNHASQIRATPRVTTLTGELPQPLLAALRERAHEDAQGPLPDDLSEWLSAQWPVRPGGREAEWSDDEVYLSLPRPGGDAWLSVALDAGTVEYERTDRGWISYFNDLHKGRNAGAAWGWFIDLFAVACLVFSITGLFLLKLHAARRRATWPLVGLGFVLPLVLAVLFIH